MTKTSFATYTGIEVDVFRVTLLQLMGNVKEYIMERAKHEPKYEDKVMACEVQSSDGIVDSGRASDAGSVVTKGRESETDKIDTTSSSMTLTRDVDAYIRPVNEHVSCAKVLELCNMVDEQKIPNKVQPTNNVDSDVVDMGKCKVDPCEQHLKHNEVSVVQCSASSVLNDDCVLHEYTAYSPDDSLTTRFNILKDQVAMYEQRARFELTGREQNMEWQMRAYISENNLKGETLKKELQSLQKQLDQTVKQKQEIQKDLNTLKHDFKDKETKFLNDFSSLKMLKNKLEDKLYTQGQTMQTAQMMHKHRKLSDDHSEKVSTKPKTNFLRIGIGAQPALFDANIMLDPNHAPPNATSDDEGNEIEDRTREKLAEKLKDPLCIANKILYNYDYTEDNQLALFVPQKKFTPEQVFWNIDIEKMKAERIVGKTRTVFRIAGPTIYPITTPMHLVPFTLPTQNNTLIALYVLGQLFTDFDKTCKKRITPTGITEGERGFEQTKRCYLTEVMPFFKLLKEHFEGLQKTLNQDVTKMKEVFEAVENEGKQLAIDLKCSEIERKNIFIMNENLIAKCIAQDVFFTATDSALSACQFHEMSIALNVFQNRVVELEGENLKLREKIQNDDHDNMVRHLSKLEVDNLNLQL
jgi:hypothetical protein